MTAIHISFLLWAIYCSFVDQSWARPSEVTELVRCDLPGCHYDLTIYCLSTGQMVTGSCKLKQRLCTNGVRNSVTAMNIFQCLSPENVHVNQEEDQLLQ
ncbi:hypothetical protein ACOMHN_007876 [Nucella lapillus]